MRRRRHDEELRRVYHDHVQAVFAFFAYSVGRQTAEDLTATTFERVVKHWARYDAARAAERTWILGIARNALVDHYRRQSHRNAASLDEHPALAGSIADDADPSSALLAADGFAGRLRGLAERERLVLAMRYGGDLSAAEIAETLGLTEANVHQISSRALRKLRAQATTG